MGIYAIGDIQGCFDDLQRLLDLIRFDPPRDRLWFTGDLVNRGPRSLETLRFVKRLGEHAVTVLGNHDLHLLAIHATGGACSGKDRTLQPVLEAPDRDELLHWLRHRPLLHFDPAMNAALLHAGLPPQWEIVEARRHAGELEQALRGPDWREFFGQMYGDRPTLWSDTLRGWERLRFIVNCLTRMRYCSVDGTIDLHSKGPPGSQPQGLLPWFQVPGRRSRDTLILFGHWSTLGPLQSDNVCALDSGCLWGGRLTALSLEEMSFRSVPCPTYCSPD